VLVREAQPENFFRAFAAAAAGDGEVFLGNPHWSDAELARALEQIPTAREAGPVRDRGWLMIPTGGSSGGIKFARHDGFTLAAAVKGFSRHFGLPQVNAVGVLPLFHVSGFVAWMRCVMTGGEYRSWDWKRLESGDWPEISRDRPWARVGCAAAGIPGDFPRRGAGVAGPARPCRGGATAPVPELRHDRDGGDGHGIASRGVPRR
jgi:O-succinylbenzoic acid--CoA ligase